MADVSRNCGSSANYFVVPSEVLAGGSECFPRPKVLAAIGTSLALLGGCSGSGYSGTTTTSGEYGGPGGGGGTSTGLVSAPGDSALATYLQRQNETWLNATDSGNSYSLVVLDKPNAGTTTFDGSGPAYSTDVTVTVAKGGDMYVANLVSTNFFLLNPYVPLGKAYGNNGSPYAVVNSPSPLPSTLTVGASGTLATAFMYHDATQSIVDGNLTTTYSVKANNASTILFCISSVVSGVTSQGTADGLSDGTETDCYSVSATGTVNLVAVTMTVNGVNLNFH
jgi:hypothetical protein